MADDNSKDKKAKLANTRKRFKELQELKRQKEASASPTSSVERSSISPVIPADQPVNCEPKNAQNIDNQYGAYNHKNTSDPYELQHNITSNNADFFDNLAPTVVEAPSNNVPQESNSTLLTYFDTSSQPEDNLENTDQNIGLAKYFDNRSPNFENVSSQQFEQQYLQNTNYTLFPQGTMQSYVSDMHNITHPHNIHDLTEEDHAGLNNHKNNHQQSQNLSKNVPEIFGGTQKLIDYLDQSVNNVINKDASTSDNNQTIVVTDSTMSADYPEISDLRQNNIDSTVSADYPEISDSRQNNIDSTVSADYPEISDSRQKNIVYPGSHNLPDSYIDQENFNQLESDEVKDKINRSTDLAKEEAQHSNVESLMQLSNALTEVIDPSYEFSASGSITDLEKRNLELAANLEKEKLNNEKLKAQNQEYLLRINDLEIKFRQQGQAPDLLQNQHEISRLKDELETHFQTIGLLVAEKTELAAAVNEYELNSKQKNAECEELQARLKASRSRVAELERELANLKEEKSKIEKLGEQYSLNYEVIKKEYEGLRETKEELAQDLLETKERLKQTLDENVEAQQQNKDLMGKLSLANIKIQQLTSSDDLSRVGSQIEQLTQQKFELENELANANQMLKSFMKERDEARTEYQHYAEQLNAQISNMQTTIEKLQQEKENLIIQEQNRIKHIGELERQLQMLQDNQVSYVTRNSSSSTELKNELESYKEMIVQLETQKISTEENYTKVCNEKELLLKELEAKTDSIAQLESMVEQLRGNQPDSVKLLATMESDKVAAARAVQQNKELKTQMESMREVFTKMDNDKINLTDQLNFEQKTNKELMEKLQKTELHLQTLAEAIEIKDRELLHLRNSVEDINRQTLQHEQLEDRLRHYEAHDHSAHALQNEILEAKTTIAKLTNELNQFKNIQGNWENKSEPVRESENSEKDKIVELTNEINRLKAQLTDQLERNLGNLKLHGDLENTESSDANQNTLDKETKVKFLEDKVTRTMQEIADLTDEKQRLEHIVLQLQGETETIGEYVALYQHQRMVLKQKALEKDYQLKQLASDRAQIKGKLDRLNQLIKKLVTEKGVIPEELIQHQESMNNHANNLCEVHSQMNAEVNNRIAQESTLNKEHIEVNTDSKATETAEEIISLLSEIKSSNLVEPEDSFHHCPYCSGQLITV